MMSLKDEAKIYFDNIADRLADRQAELNREYGFYGAVHRAVDKIDGMQIQFVELQTKVAELSALVAKAPTKGSTDEEPHSDGTDTSSDHPGSL